MRMLHAVKACACRERVQGQGFSLQVEDGNIVVGSSQTLIEGLSQEARVTKVDDQGLILGFELQDGPRSMVDIALGKVSDPLSAHLL